MFYREEENMTSHQNDKSAVIDSLNAELKGYSPLELLNYFSGKYPGKVLQSSSMGAEDQVITDMIVAAGKEIPVITLDTGRLFPETYRLIEETARHYGIQIRVYFPDYKAVEKMVNSKGINLFYESVENRKLCCHIRKKEPLKRALRGMDVWVCGLRKDQSLTRFYNKRVEWDDQNGLIKVNPLIDWCESEVWDYIRSHHVPFNRLHEKGYKSIGCRPCTRPVKSGEEFRSGRWWWEEQEKRECGLHDGGD